MLCSCAVAVSLDKENFCRAVAVVVAHAAYLPSVECFALLPIASTLARTGAETGAALDYDIDNACVTLKAQRTIRYSCLYHTEVHVVVLCGAMLCWPGCAALCCAVLYCVVCMLFGLLQLSCVLVQRATWTASCLPTAL